jgi:divalent metal cation (Fe/Co/Zn/Cd) transporter
LIGEAAGPESETAIVDAIESSPRVMSLIHLKTQHIGPDELLVGAKVDFVPQLDIAQLADAINEVETSIRAAVPSARVIYLEPDLRRS